MTIVIGRKFGNRILLMSDTLITDLHQVRHHKLPGRLKAIVLGPNLSIAFAGDAELGLGLVRDAKVQLRDGASTPEVVQRLTTKCGELSGLCEFLIASHDPDAVLRKVTANGLSQPVSGAVIGDQEFLKLLPNYSKAAGDDEFAESGGAVERELMNAFNYIFLARRGELPDGVGGVPITLLASPLGHTYQACSSAFSWDVIDLKVGVTDDQLYDQISGMTEWRYSIQCPTQRGSAVVSLYLPQARAGYVFDPINFDEPIHHPDISQHDFEQAVMNRTS
ncbi:MAG: hypothetical protein U1E18_09110 [Brevundimonas sp.]|uniref:hypothetical protein n=1 Tax=Brevundimonas sp. TaxID=1871086 RepID=UPI002AB927BE|nr:hypothetical protein [Brevundimonas sp.]MDZ4109741.1 hypothetical protein [Brevundimonas sp.]